MHATLSTASVSRILGMSPARVRAVVRSGLCRPAGRGRRYAFSFSDLVVLRAANELFARRVPAARVYRALAALARELPDGGVRGLSGLRIYADGGSVVARQGAAAWRPEDGQTVFNFDVDDLAELVDADQAQHVPAEPAASGPTAQAVFERALVTEERDAEAAMDGYRRAIDLDPGFVDAYVNLGRLTHERGNPHEATRLYALALHRCPNDAVIHFNLALAVEDTLGPAFAVSHYARAVELDPDFADAHYNLAALCEELGRTSEAIRHLHTYKRLTRER
ncbi:MAG: tetratricopeptide repeat protein [Myxococcales bacterium FL481]|nr:MAG: tetratricopeptide repeat protein [Myxococcales bacterium FL481]